MWRCEECDYCLCEACALQRAALRPGHHIELPLQLQLRLISGHHFPRPQKEQSQRRASVTFFGKFGSLFDDNDEPISPYAHVKIHGVECDNSKQTTQVSTSNGFDPVWDETFEFNISRPDVAIMTLQVFDHVSKAFVVAAAYPVNMLREGIRWVPMWDYRLRTLEHCGLLVEIRMRRGDEDAKLHQTMLPLDLTRPSAGTGAAEGPDGPPLSAGTGAAEGMEAVDDGLQTSRESSEADVPPERWSRDAEPPARVSLTERREQEAPLQRGIVLERYRL